MKWISDLSIKRKILATIISTVALIAIFAVWAASSSISVQNAQTKMLKSGLIAQDLLLNADRDLYQAYTAVQSLVLADNSKEEIDSKLLF